MVADIHFHYKRAIEAAENGASCLRINPGNIGDKKKIIEVIKSAKDNNCSIRVGVNAGSLEKDILENLKTIKDIPHKISGNDFPEEIDIRGEVFIQNNDFKKLSDKFANPRNAASGSLRQKNPMDTKKIPLKFIAYTFGYEKGLLVNNQIDYLKKLSVWGFKTNPLNKLISGIKNLMKNYDDIEKKRSNLDFDIIVKGECKEDDIVSAHITDWKYSLPEGKILKIIGNKEETNTQIHAILEEYNLPYFFSKEVFKRSQ